MPVKVYTKLGKEKIRSELLETALELYSRNGIRNVTLMDILKPVGISKPFFYTYFNSVQEFVVAVLEFQWTKFSAFLDEVDGRADLCWEEKIETIFEKVIYYNDSGFLIMTQEEEVWVRKYIDDKEYDNFMENQIMSFAGLLQRWDISIEKCNPKVFANMFLSIILIHSSAKKSLPFLYVDCLDDTAKAQVKSVIAYLKPLREQ